MAESFALRISNCFENMWNTTEGSISVPTSITAIQRLKRKIADFWGFYITTHTADMYEEARSKWEADMEFIEAAGLTG